jgi:hypothetical protein
MSERLTLQPGDVFKMNGKHGVKYLSYYIAYQVDIGIFKLFIFNSFNRYTDVSYKTIEEVKNDGFEHVGSIDPLKYSKEMKKLFYSEFALLNFLISEGHHGEE